jgi:hypothetical protein
MRPESFVPLAVCTAAFLVGAPNAVNAPRERDRWYCEFPAEAGEDHGVAATREATMGLDAGKRIVRLRGRRLAKRFVVRASRIERRNRKIEKGRVK